MSLGVASAEYPIPSVVIDFLMLNVSHQFFSHQFQSFILLKLFFRMMTLTFAKGMTKSNHKMTKFSHNLTKFSQIVTKFSHFVIRFSHAFGESQCHHTEKQL